MFDQEKKARLLIVADVVAGLVLFGGTAFVVWSQNSRLTVLYDLSGVLEHAARIAQGDLPYRDFPFLYAPLTFLIQAALIKLTGAVYWHHIAYACAVGGLATVLTWRILIYLVRETLPRPSLVAFILSLPLMVLGIYCIFPHPFYDPDATFMLLLGVFLVLWLETRGFPIVITFLAGMLLVVPLFIKQNIGLAFLGSASVWLLAVIVVNVWKKRPIRPCMLLLGGVAAGLAISFAIIQYTVGFDNYWLWTITVASARRAPSLRDMLSVYQDWMLAFWVVIFLLGAYLLFRAKDRKRWQTVLWVAVMAVPFIWPVVYLAIDQDASERAERLTAFWPFIFIVSFGLAYLFIRRLNGVAAALPFVLICSAHGVFLSQQLWGSTYGIWPLLIILIALVLRQIYDPEDERSRAVVTALAACISVSLIIAGAFYLYSNERLEYVNLDDGELAHSTLPQLAGLSIRGSYLPDFEELIKYSDENIPRDDGILCLPGEDLFYYTTGRHPHFPVLLFDVTNNPYDANEIRDRVLASDIEWIIVKNDTQIEADNMIDSKTVIFELLKPDFRNVESLNNYEIYKRRHADDPKDDEDDNSGDDSDSGDDSPDDGSSN